MLLKKIPVCYSYIPKTIKRKSLSRRISEFIYQGSYLKHAPKNEVSWWKRHQNKNINIDSTFPFSKFPSKLSKMFFREYVC